MQTLAIANFDLPGDRGFPLNALYAKPSDKSEAGIYHKFIDFVIVEHLYVRLKDDGEASYSILQK